MAFIQPAEDHRKKNIEAAHQFRELAKMIEEDPRHPMACMIQLLWSDGMITRVWNVEVGQSLFPLIGILRVQSAEFEHDIMSQPG